MNTQTKTISKKDALKWDDAHRRNSEFLCSVEASLCARDLRGLFWDYLAFLLKRREQNPEYSAAQAVTEILNDHFDV